MKKLLIITLAVTFLSCNSDKIISYTYSVVTRGYKLEITVAKDSTHISQSGRQVLEKDYATNPDLWKFLNKNSKTVKLDEIGGLESPTNKRQFDAAMFASLTISTKDSVYRSCSFDAGHPPSMIKNIVDELVKESEKINEK
jgi:predicted nuclease of predicted toxin-antitoxin system